MSRLMLLVNGVERRFAVSTGSTDSYIPSYMVPPGEVRREPTVQLRDMVGNLFKMLGTYHCVLEYPGLRLTYALNVAQMTEPRVECIRMGVLGVDFIHLFKTVIFKGGVIEVRQAGGRRLTLTESENREKEEGVIYLPTVRRVSSELRFPPPLPGPQPARKAVFIDLETTGFGSDAELVQVAVKYGDKVLSVYVLPQGDIPPSVAKVTGFVKRDGALFVRDVKKATVSPRQAVQLLLGFLRRRVGGNAVLVAHNAFSFDAHHLLKLVRSLGLMRDFQSLVMGFTDTLPLFRAAMPERTYQGKKFSLEFLARDFLKSGVSDLHDAEEDIRVLERLVKLAGLTPQRLLASARPLHNFSAFGFAEAKVVIHINNIQTESR